MQAEQPTGRNWY